MWNREPTEQGSKDGAVHRIMYQGLLLVVFTMDTGRTHTIRLHDGALHGAKEEALE